MMTPTDLDKLIEKYLQGKCTQQECDFINSWYSDLGKDLSALAGPDEGAISASGERILRNLQIHSKPEPVFIEAKKRSMFWPFIRIAASILLCAVAGFYFLSDYSSVPPSIEKNDPSIFTSMANEGEATKRVILPDGSMVALSPGSKIRYSPDVTTATRELFLDGEAYFDVARDPARPFFVYAGDLVTRVLGTTFTIRASGPDGKVIVSVKTGSVTVYTRKAVHKKTLLAPNQEAVYDRKVDVVATHVVALPDADAPTRNYTEMHFEETPVPEVLSMLNRTYDIEILFDTAILSGCVLTSSFYEEGLYDRIDVICTAIGASYKIVDAQIVIESEGCNLKDKL